MYSSIFFLLFTGPSAKDAANNSFVLETVHHFAFGQARRLHVGCARWREGRGARACRPRDPSALLQAQNEECCLD